MNDQWFKNGHAHESSIIQEKWTGRDGGEQKICTPAFQPIQLIMTETLHP
jgi:hypothetical protein